jgi:hypothetical protein
VSAPTTLLHHPVSQDWTRWAATASARVCEACSRTFQPNHPRRRFCGQADCDEITRANRPQTEPTAARRRRQTGVQGILADVVVELNRTDAPTGQRDEIRSALADVIKAENAGRPNQIRSALVRLQATLVARTMQLQAELPAETPLPLAA